MYITQVYMAFYPLLYVVNNPPPPPPHFLKKTWDHAYLLILLWIKKMIQMDAYSQLWLPCLTGHIWTKSLRFVHNFFSSVLLNLSSWSLFMSLYTTETFVGYVLSGRPFPFWVVSSMFELPFAALTLVWIA